jgi:UDP-N-acetylmuramate--alanine ligase
MRTIIPDSLYFIGAGGIGMSALARYFNMLGKRVAGYDLTRTRLTDRLEKEGIEISYEDDEGKIPAVFLEPGAKEKAIVVYTPAIPSGNRVFQFFTGNGYNVLKRSRLLGELVNDARGIAVAGTHGKTSVSALTAHILKNSASGCNAFLGGLAKNYNSNLVVDDKSDLVVAEADEYDRSFLQLYPSVAVITSMDPDHLDIYGDFESMKQAFITFASQVKDEGVLIYRKGLDIVRHLPVERFSGVAGKGSGTGRPAETGIRTISYGIGPGADFSAVNIRMTGKGLPLFDIRGPAMILERVELGVPGRFNVENAVAATAAASACGANEQEIRKGLESYQGLSRRFEIIINLPGCVLIDDYAHHPAELAACISAVREIFPGRKVTGIFQPHLYTRTRDFADGFARSLEALDEVILLDIYPAREVPLPGVTSQMILDRIGGINKSLCHKEELTSALSGRPTDIVVTMGAGNIDVLVEPVKRVLLSKCRKQ